MVVSVLTAGHVFHVGKHASVADVGVFRWSMERVWFNPSPLSTYIFVAVCKPCMIYPFPPACAVLEE